MKRWFAIFVGILTTLVCHAGDTYYVIQNVETGQFMQYIKDNDIAHHEDASFIQSFPTDDASIKNAIWKITSTTDGGFSIYNMGKGAYLNSKIGTDLSYKDYYKDCYSSTSTTFYIFPNPFNEQGFAVSYKAQTSTDNINKYCWYAYYNNKYWLCSTEDASLDVSEHGSGLNKYYYLSSFRFLSFRDLYNQAKVLLGDQLTINETDSVDTNNNPKYANYATLVNDIVNNLPSGVFNTSLFNNISDPVVLRNQRYGTYLAMNASGKLYITEAVNADCLWNASTVDADNGQYVFINSTTGKALNIYYTYKTGIFSSKTDSRSTLTLYKSDEADTAMYSTYPSGYFRISGVFGDTKQYLLTNGKDTTETTTYSASNSDKDNALWVNGADWEAIPFNQDANADYLAVKESNLQDSLFFRIENEGYALAGKKWGWLSYDDHVDMRGVSAVKKYLSDIDENGNAITDPNKIYAYSVQAAKSTKTKTMKTNSLSSANALWHFILKAKANNKNDDGPGIGIVDNHTNNIYAIKNANSLQYLALPGDNGNTGTTINGTNYYFMKTTSELSKAALFWLEDLGNGQYAIAVRDPVNSSLSDKCLGYLRILDDGQVGSSNPGYYRAALVLEKTTTKPSRDDTNKSSHWCLLQATHLNVKAAPATKTFDENEKLADKIWGESKGADGFRYVASYYPFNVTPTNSDAKVFKGTVDTGDKDHVFFKEVNNNTNSNTTIPGFTGALVMVPNTEANSNIEFSINSYKDVSGFDRNVLTGITECEKGPDFGDEYKTGESAETTKLRNQYYILTTETENGNTDNSVKFSLMHPSDAWLKENRAYIYEPISNSAKYLPYKFLLDDPATSISPIKYPSLLDGYWYNLSGQRVLQPANGLFIHNGKKILVK